jgi:hypothetical protein
MIRSRILLAAFLIAAWVPNVQAASYVVREPAYDIPHIHADTDAELYFEYGRQDAKDRLGQFVILTRAARGTLAQLFGSGSVGSDVGTRGPAYSSKELNDMFAKLPADAQAAIDNYCAGANAEINAVLSGPTSAMPTEVFTAVAVGLGANLFGNATNISDQVDPGYSPTSQFTRELSIANAILQVRNFGSSSGFGNEFSNLTALNGLIAKFGVSTGTAVWNDIFITNDPLSPVSVPDPTTPGFGGPLAQAPISRGTMYAAVTKPLAHIVAAVRPTSREARELGGMLASLFVPNGNKDLAVVAASDAALIDAKALPKYDYQTVMAKLEGDRAEREAHLRKIGAYPYIGSYMWLLDGARAHGGDPWLGGFPQTGIQTPSIMHVIEASSAEGTDHRVSAVGMTFIGAPSVLIGHTNNVAFTTTTAGLKNTNLIGEAIVNETTDNARYFDGPLGAPVQLAKRNETINVLFAAPQVHTFFRSKVRLANGGSRPIASFIADRVATAAAGSNATTINTTGLVGSYVGGWVMLTSRTGAGQIRPITANTATSITVSPAFTVAPVSGQTGFAAVKSGGTIVAVAIEFSFWREETDTAYGFSLFQRAENILDIRRGVRWIPSTHNFNAADNKPFNGVGTDTTGKGNIGYWSSGLAPVRQFGDPRLPIDGTGPNPLVVFSGTVTSAGANTLTDGGAPFNIDLSPEPLNFAYDNPGQTGSEYIVVITGGTGHQQTRRIASNTATALTLEENWGVVPAPGDTYEVMEIIAVPEAINPIEGYTANWNGKASRATTPVTGREFRHTFILERLSLQTAADRDFNRQLNDDLAGIEGDGKRGRYLLPRLRTAVNQLGGLSAAELATLAQLEANNAFPIDGRRFIDPVTSTTESREIDFIQTWIDNLSAAIFNDELSGTGVSIPSGGQGRREAVTHAVDTAAADVPGSLILSQDYFNGADWRTVFIAAYQATHTALGGVQAPNPRGTSSYVHPFGFAFPTTPRGNRGTYEQIVQVEPTKAKCGGPRGEYIFPLGQSGFIPNNGAPFSGNFAGRSPHTESLHPIWRDWRFVPMLKAGATIASANGDADGNGILDAWECWHFDKTGVAATSQQNGPGDPDGDRLSNLEEYQAGSDPNDSDTDDDGVLDGFDAKPQNRLDTTARTPTVEPTSDKGRGDGSGTGKGH